MEQELRVKCQFCNGKFSPATPDTAYPFCHERCKTDQRRYTDWLSDSGPMSLAGHVPGETRDTHAVLPSSSESFHDIIMRTGGYPVHGAHRGGGSVFGPENTLPCFRKSVEHGARLLELDLRLTKDMHPVLMHWATVDSTTDGKGRVSDYTLEEIRKLDASFHFEPLRGSGVRVPTLVEFLDEFVPVKDLLFFFDFKDCLTYLLSMKCIARYNIANRYCLGSVLRDCNSMILQTRLSSQVPVCTDVIQTLKILARYHLGLLFTYNFTHDMVGFVLHRTNTFVWSGEFVRAIQASGRRVVVSGFGEELNKESRLRECVQYGVDYIMTDRPDLLQRIIEEERERQ